MKPLSVSEIQELDRRTIEDFGISSLCLMENAGRAVGDVAMDMLSGNKTAYIFCGTGNNGGDGFVAGRYLKRQGVDIKLYILGDRSKIKKDANINLGILNNVGVKAEEVNLGLETINGLIVDAIFGVGLRGEVRQPSKSIIQMLNRSKAPILSIDVPSGLDADTGEILGVSVKATKTITMHRAKKGFFLSKGPEHTGEVIIADIGLIEGDNICVG